MCIIEMSEDVVLTLSSPLSRKAVILANQSTHVCASGQVTECLLIQFHSFQSNLSRESFCISHDVPSSNSQVHEIPLVQRHDLGDKRLEVENGLGSLLESVVL